MPNLQQLQQKYIPLIKKYKVEILVFGIMILIPLVLFSILLFQNTNIFAKKDTPPTSSPSTIMTTQPTPELDSSPELSSSASPRASASASPSPKASPKPSPRPTPTISATTQPTPSPSPSPSPTTAPSPTSTQLDLEMVGLVFHEANSNNETEISPPFPANQQITLRYKIRNNGPNTSGSYRVTFIINGETRSIEHNAPAIPPGGWNGPSENVTSATGFTVRAGENSIQATVEVMGNYSDTNSGNNSKTITFQSNSSILFNSYCAPRSLTKWSCASRSFSGVGILTAYSAFFS